MAESKIIKFRCRPELLTAIRTMQDVFQYPTISAAVTQLIEEGILYHERRKKAIQHHVNELNKLKAKNHEVILLEK